MIATASINFPILQAQRNFNDVINEVLAHG
jgi:hypothetical protein